MATRACHARPVTRHVCPPPLMATGLNDFLDMKKSAFPRFYFLANEEVLEVRRACSAAVKRLAATRA